MEIRDATLFDVPAIARLYEAMRRQLARHYNPEKLSIPIPSKYWEDHFFELVFSGQHHILVACDPLGHVVGMLDAGSPAHSRREDWDDTESYFPFCDYQLHALYVDIQYRRRRIGTLLMQYLADKTEGKAASVIAWVHESDTMARDFWLRLGARVASVREMSLYGRPYVENAYLWHVPAAPTMAAQKHTHHHLQRRDLIAHPRHRPGIWTRI